MSAQNQMTKESTIVAYTALIMAGILGISLFFGGRFASPQSTQSQQLFI